MNWCDRSDYVASVSGEFCFILGNTFCICKLVLSSCLTIYSGLCYQFVWNIDKNNLMNDENEVLVFFVYTGCRLSVYNKFIRLFFEWFEDKKFV